MKLEELVCGVVVSQEEIKKILVGTKKGIIAYKKKEGRLIIYSSSPIDLEHSRGRDVLKKNKTGAEFLFGVSNVFCFEGNG